MTIAEQVKNTMNMPLDENFKQRVSDIICRYAEQYDIRKTVFEFIYGGISGGNFGYKPRCVRHTDYTNGKNTDLFIYLIDVPQVYETKKKQVEEWILSEGFVRKTGYSYYDDCFCFVMA